MGSVLPRGNIGVANTLQNPERLATGAATQLLAARSHPVAHPDRRVVLSSTCERPFERSFDERYSSGMLSWSHPTLGKQPGPFAVIYCSGEAS